MPSIRQKCFRFASALLNYYKNESDSNQNRCCYHSGRTKDECLGILKEYSVSDNHCRFCNCKINLTLSFHLCFWCIFIQPQFKYILKHRPALMTPSQMCCSKHNICNEKTDPIDFTIEYDREPVFKVNGFELHWFDENKFYGNIFAIRRHQKSIISMKKPWIRVQWLQFYI